MGMNEHSHKLTKPNKMYYIKETKMNSMAMNVSLNMVINMGTTPTNIMIKIKNATKLSKMAISVKQCETTMSITI